MGADPEKIEKKKKKKKKGIQPEKLMVTTQFVA
jgi:hypothetical protein